MLCLLQIILSLTLHRSWSQSFRWYNHCFFQCNNVCPFCHGLSSCASVVFCRRISCVGTLKNFLLVQILMRFSPGFAGGVLGWDWAGHKATGQQGWIFWCVLVSLILFLPCLLLDFPWGSIGLGSKFFFLDMDAFPSSEYVCRVALSMNWMQHSSLLILYGCFSLPARIWHTHTTNVSNVNLNLLMLTMLSILWYVFRWCYIELLITLLCPHILVASLDWACVWACCPSVTETKNPKPQNLGFTYCPNQWIVLLN